MFEVKLKDGSVKEFDEEISLLDVCKRRALCVPVLREDKVTRTRSSNR